jgi:hypothetical protein
VHDRLFNMQRFRKTYASESRDCRHNNGGTRLNDEPAGLFLDKTYDRPSLKETIFVNPTALFSTSDNHGKFHVPGGLVPSSCHCSSFDT